MLYKHTCTTREGSWLRKRVYRGGREKQSKPETGVGRCREARRSLGTGQCLPVKAISIRSKGAVTI